MTPINHEITIDIKYRVGAWEEDFKKAHCACGWESGHRIGMLFLKAEVKAHINESIKETPYDESCVIFI